MPFTPSVGLDQNQDGTFIDRYWGRIPKFTHRVPEQNICEANEDYITLIGLFIDGEVSQKNISKELYREVYDFVDKMCNPCIMNEEDQALMRAYDGLDACPDSRCDFDCDEILCCNELLSCECDEACAIPTVVPPTNV